MLDIQFIRDNADQVTQKAKQKGYEVNVGELLQLDEERRNLKGQIDEKQRQRNAHAAMFKETKGVTSQENIVTGKALK
jgi:seryl-tRNA synthetase